MPQVNQTSEPRPVEVGDMVRAFGGITEETGVVHLVTAHVAYFQCRTVGCACRLPVTNRAHSSHSVWRTWLDWEIVPADGTR